ncbi:MAG: MFS transporter, partial [Moorellaceae bacterium]
ARLAGQITAANPAVDLFFRQAEAYLGGGLVTGSQVKTLALAYLQGIVTQTSFVRALDDIFVLMALLVLVGLLPSLFLEKGSGKSRPGISTE